MAFLLILLLLQGLRAGGTAAAAGGRRARGPLRAGARKPPVLPLYEAAFKTKQFIIYYLLFIEDERFVFSQAEKHFRSALRLSPTDARAKAGYAPLLD